MQSIVSKLPSSLKNMVRPLKQQLHRLLYRGTNRYCPVCTGHFSRFLASGVAARPDSRCPGCSSLERHRLSWLFLQNHTNLFDGRPKKMLHVSPEPCFEPRLRRQLGQQYLTADLFNPQVMVKMDITDIQYPNETFDLIYCSHVLEHVQDDIKAMRQFYRVLKTDGWAILLVPITREKTFEDPSVTDPKERLRLFGQEDHVRHYGLDYVDRLRQAGFTVQRSQVTDLATPAQITQMALSPASGDIYYCTK